MSLAKNIRARARFHFNYRLFALFPQVKFANFFRCQSPFERKGAGKTPRRSAASHNQIEATTDGADSTDQEGTFGEAVVKAGIRRAVTGWPDQSKDERKDARDARTQGRKKNFQLIFHRVLASVPRFGVCELAAG